MKSSYILYLSEEETNLISSLLTSVWLGCTNQERELAMKIDCKLYSNE